MSRCGDSYGQGRRTRRNLLMQAVVALGSGQVLHAAVDASTVASVPGGGGVMDTRPS